MNKEANADKHLSKELSDKPQKFTLIDGDFGKQEAKEVLINLINYKIKFHNQKIFSISEMSGEKDQKSVERLYELSKTLRHLKEMLDNLRDEDNLYVCSTISITKKSS